MTIQNETTPVPMSEAELNRYKLHRRFDRMGRLVGDQGMQRLLNSHVMVIGLGGVGSQAAEALVRSGVGALTLVDFDDVCITNFNRQIQAIQGNVGKKKSFILKERLAQINPHCQLREIPKFYDENSHDEIFSKRPDFVVDAIDHVTTKCRLMVFCRNEKIPFVTATGSGGRFDPTVIKVADLADTTVDPLARDLRRILREKYAFPAEGSFGIRAVYSDEIPQRPKELSYDGGKGFRCVCPQGENNYFQCENRNLIMGNAGFVTGAFGFVCASVAVQSLLSQEQCEGPNLTLH